MREANMAQKTVQLNLVELNERYVTINGVRTRYLTLGSGTPLLLIHGLGEFMEVWLFNIPELSKHLAVYTLDLPGLGKSDECKQEYSLAFGIRFVIDFIKAMGIQQINLLGHSMSGPLVINIALEFPDIVKKLILVDSGGFSSDAPFIYRLATLPLLGEALMKPTIKSAIRVGLKKRFYNPQVITEEWVDMVYRYLKMPKTKNTMLNIVRHCATIKGSLPELVITGKLARVTQATLIIHGKQDNLFPVENAISASKLIPNSRLKIIEECGHNPHLEKPAEFNEAVLSFLQND